MCDQLGLRTPRDRRRQQDAPAQPSADGEGLPARQGHLYGPLQTTATDSGSGHWSVIFKPDNVDRQVNKIPESALEKVPPTDEHELKVKVSLDDRPVLENPEHTCTYHLIMAGDFARWVEKEGTQLVLEGYDSLIRRHAKTFFSRKKSQDFKKLLDELADRVNGSPEPSDGDAAQVVKRLGVRLAEIDAAGDELARSLLASGVLEPRLGPLLEQAERDHVERNTARLQAEIDLRVVRLRSELESLERQRNERRQKLDHEIQEGRREIERVQALQRQEFEGECEAERECLGAQKQELDRQRDLLSNSLQQVAQQMAEGRDSLVNQFLAISPLLQQLNLLTRGPFRGRPGRPPRAPAAEAERPAADARLPPRRRGFVPGRRGIVLPAFLRARRAPGYEVPPDRPGRLPPQRQVPRPDRPGGPPGTGKSSLPRLYAEALLGEEATDGRGRYLHVGVSPSWLDCGPDRPDQPARPLLPAGRMRPVFPPGLGPGGIRRAGPIPGSTWSASTR